MNKKILFLVCGMILISLVGLASAGEFKSHKQNTPFTLTLTSNNATGCTLLDVQYPAGNTVNFTTAMLKNRQSFSTTLDGNNYTTLGDTCHFISCTDGSTQETGSVCRDVTPSGFRDTLGFYFIILLVVGALIFLGFYSKDGWFVVAGGMGFILIGLYSINFGIAGQRDMFITWGIGLFEIFMGGYLSMMASFEIMNE